MGDESTFRPMMTPQEVARCFNVDPKTVSRWARRGRIPASKTPGGHHRFRREDVQALLETQGEVEALMAEAEAGVVLVAGGDCAWRHRPARCV